MIKEMILSYNFDNLAFKSVKQFSFIKNIASTLEKIFTAFLGTTIFFALMIFYD